MRYPGGKKRMRKQIVPILQSMLTENSSYHEPFCGSAAIGIAVLPLLKDGAYVHWNDLDSGVVDYWRAVRDYPEELCEQIDRFTPSVEAFNVFKQYDGRREDVVVGGFRKLALHAMSFGGLGPLAGGPIGGQDQTGSYKVGCRWSPKALKQEVRSVHRQLQRVATSFSNCSYLQCLSDLDAASVVYLDPPYVQAGPGLYKHSFTDADHDALCEALWYSPAKWLLSYDDHPSIHARYHWSHIETIGGSTQHGGKGTRKIPELLIRPRA